MKIAMLAPFEERIPPEKYGGTELVVANLVENLVGMGEEVTLLASGDSKTEAKLKPVFPQALRFLKEAQEMDFRNALKFMGVGKVVSLLRKENFDIIHNHIGWRFLPFQELINCPTITTLHGPLGVPYQQRVYGTYPKANYVSISLSQRLPMPELNFVANVYNGIETEKFKFYRKPKDYFAFLGRMSPEKGPVEAIKIAQKAGVKLLMAAKIDVVDREFFKEKVEPLIDGRQIKFIGEIGHAEKVKFLGNSRALIAPIQWEEPFGLFFVEAMACGTPVIAMRRGSVPEIVLDGKTGFICEGIEEAAEKIKQVDELNRKDCWDHVKNNFTAKKMAQDYLAVFKETKKRFLKSKGKNS